MGQIFYLRALAKAGGVTTWETEEATEGRKDFDSSSSERREITSCDASCNAMMGGNRMKWRMWGISSGMGESVGDTKAPAQLTEE
jgi:hypothetical protein